MEGTGDEFGDEDVVVGCVTDGAADDADRKCQGCNGGDEVLVEVLIGGAREQTSGEVEGRRGR